MRPRSAIAALAAVLGLALAGCGSSGGSPNGRAVFAQACSSCHTLAAGYDPRRQGGSLLEFHASRAVLTQFAAEMPVRRPLSAAQLRAVVTYVLAVEGRRGAGSG